MNWHCKVGDDLADIKQGFQNRSFETATSKSRQSHKHWFLQFLRPFLRCFQGLGWRFHPYTLTMPVQLQWDIGIVVPFLIQPIDNASYRSKNPQWVDRPLIVQRLPTNPKNGSKMKNYWEWRVQARNLTHDVSQQKILIRMPTKNIDLVWAGFVSHIEHSEICRRIIWWYLVVRLRHLKSK